MPTVSDKDLLILDCIAQWKSAARAILDGDSEPWPFSVVSVLAGALATRFHVTPNLQPTDPGEIDNIAAILCSLEDTIVRGEQSHESTPSRPLDKEDLVILQTLAERPDCLHTLDDIDLHRQTASNHLNALISAGYVVRPRGERKGAVITALGKSKLAESLRTDEP